jgi:hypothetical protein
VVNKKYGIVMPTMQMTYIPFTRSQFFSIFCASPTDICRKKKRGVSQSIWVVISKKWFPAVIGGIIMPSVSPPRHSERNNEVVAVEESGWFHRKPAPRSAPFAQPTRCCDCVASQLRSA